MVFKNKNKKNIILTKDIELRKINFDDPSTMSFLRELYKSTRIEEMNRSGWSVSEIDKFLDQQFFFQHTSYINNNKDGLFFLIVYKNEIRGRLYLDYRETETRIIDIALIAEVRGEKIGTTIINILKAEAKSMNKALNLHVEYDNKARELYKRLEFEEVAKNEIYILMEYNPKALN